MLPVSSYFPRFLDLHHSLSPSPQPSLAKLCHDTAVSADPSCVDVSRASSSRPSSELGSPDQDVQEGPGTSSLYYPNCIRSSPVDPAPDGQPSRSVSQVTSPLPHILSSYVTPSQSQHLCPPNLTYGPPSPQSLVTQDLPYRHGALLQQSLNSQHVMQFSSQYSQHSQAWDSGMFNQAHGFTATGAFVDGNVGTVNIDTSNQFMEKLLDRTIPGASFDSSARYPPPRCHAGTRLAILGRCLRFIANCSDGQKRVRWVVGAAGVGKSAIMQSVAESPELPVGCHASVFFSINGRNDGFKSIVTISYQLAVKSGPYRQVIEYEISRDPSLLHSSMPVQFKKLIVEPFIHYPPLSSVGRVLIIIDGLDECSDTLTQQELLRLISDFCIDYPSSPLVWLIASRPETHITSFFSREEVAPVYEKEEILVDSNEARTDVERFLRDKFTEITKASHSLDPQWLKERDFWKIVSASGGLFAYAQTVVRYIEDPNIANPVSQLSDVLNVIDEHPMTDLSQDHPMALLDALYARILSKVPSKINKFTRKLLLALVSDWDATLRTDSFRTGNFFLLCNWLGMTPDEAYAAVNHLHSVFQVPRRNKAYGATLEPFHKSFIDYISDFSRSGLFPDIKREGHQLMAQCAIRILKEAPDGVDLGSDTEILYGSLRRGPTTGNNKILLTWRVDEDVSRYDNKTSWQMYKLAIGEVVAGMERRDPTFLNPSYARLLATRFEEYAQAYFPYDEIRDFVFDDSRRDEFVTHGLLKQIPLKTFVAYTIICDVKLRFRRLATTATDLRDPWNSFCKHKREGQWEQGKDTHWITHVSLGKCEFCSDRFLHRLKRWRTEFPDHTAQTLLTSTGYCCVEFRFVDLQDSMAEWTYWFWCRLWSGEREKYGIPV